MKPPIYSFGLQEDGTIEKRVYTQYTIRLLKHGDTVYGHSNWISTPQGIVTKDDPGQMDRVLHGYLYTYDPDEDRAKRLILAAYEEKLHKAEAMVRQYGETLQKIHAHLQEEIKIR